MVRRIISHVSADSVTSTCGRTLGNGSRINNAHDQNTNYKRCLGCDIRAPNEPGEGDIDEWTLGGRADRTHQTYRFSRVNLSHRIPLPTTIRSMNAFILESTAEHFSAGCTSIGAVTLQGFEVDLLCPEIRPLEVLLDLVVQLRYRHPAAAVSVG